MVLLKVLFRLSVPRTSQVVFEIVSAHLHRLQEEVGPQLSGQWNAAVQGPSDQVSLDDLEGV